MDVVGKHQVDVLVVLAGKHGIAAADLPWEERHTFVFRGRSIQGNELKVQEIRSFHQFRHDVPAIEGGERRVVDVGTIVVPKANEAGVLDAVALRRCGREQYPLRQLLLRLELDLVVGPGEHPNPLRGLLIFLRHSIWQAELLPLEPGAKIFQCKRLPEFVHDPAR